MISIFSRQKMSFVKELTFFCTIVYIPRDIFGKHLRADFIREKEIFVGIRTIWISKVCLVSDERGMHPAAISITNPQKRTDPDLNQLNFPYFNPFATDSLSLNP